MIKKDLLWLTILCFLSMVAALHVQKQTRAIYHDQKFFQARIDKLVEQSKYSSGNNSNTMFEKKSCGEYTYLEVSPKDMSTEESLLNVMIVCNIHAREFLSSQICLKFIQSLFQEVSQHSKVSAAYRIFYIANTERENSLKNDKCIRKNKNGVDLNRNFPTQFNSYNQSQDSQIYSGTEPLSEKFSKCLEQLIEKQKPDFFLDVHTGDMAIFYQKSRPFEKSLDNQRDLIESVLNTQNSLCEQCRVTTLQKDGQLINGHIFADLKVRKKLKYSILIETYKVQRKDRILSSTLSQSEKCFLIFNPSTEKQKNRYLRKWVAIIKAMVKQIMLKERKSQNVQR